MFAFLLQVDPRGLYPVLTPYNHSNYCDFSPRILSILIKSGIAPGIIGEALWEYCGQAWFAQLCRGSLI